jgi:hypothetical protein
VHCNARFARALLLFAHEATSLYRESQAQIAPARKVLRAKTTTAKETPMLAYAILASIAAVVVLMAVSAYRREHR